MIRQKLQILMFLSFSQCLASLRYVISMFFICCCYRYPDVSDRQKMLWDAKYQTLSKQLNITEQMEKKIKGIKATNVMRITKFNIIMYVAVFYV